MNEPSDYLAKRNKSEKDKYHTTSHMWNIKYDTNGLVYETETDSQTQRGDLLLPRWGLKEKWIESSALADANYYTYHG